MAVVGKIPRYLIVWASPAQVKREVGTDYLVKAGQYALRQSFKAARELSHRKRSAGWITGIMETTSSFRTNPQPRKKVRIVQAPIGWVVAVEEGRTMKIIAGPFKTGKEAREWRPGQPLQSNPKKDDPHDEANWPFRLVAINAKRRVAVIRAHLILEEAIEQAERLGRRHHDLYCLILDRKTRKIIWTSPFKNPRHAKRMSANPRGTVRLGKAIEIRYERDHGKFPGFYKHEFTSGPSVLYRDRSNEVVVK